MKKSLRILLLILSLSVFLVSAFFLLQYGFETLSEKNFQSDLISAAVSPASQGSAPNSEENAESGEAEKDLPVCPITVNFDLLLEQNPDVIGWLYCENTPIHYPIVKSKDNLDYLHLRLDGTRSDAGTLFADFRAASDFSDLNTVIYGHNMKNKTMFGTLLGYKEQSYYEAHPVLWLLTPNGNYQLRPLCGIVVPSDDEGYHTDFTPESLQNYLKQCVGKSLFSLSDPTEAETARRIVSLSTCSYEFQDARFVLITSLIPAK